MQEPRAAVRAAGRRLMRRGARGVRKVAPWKRILTYLAILGPGMITANAGNDAGGIATFASVGAEFGYQLLWVLIPITISLGIVQEMCARMGAVTGKGLADLIREQFGVRWTALIMLALLIANAGVTVSEFVGIAAATELFGVPRFISVPFAAILIWWLIVKGSYQRVERAFLLMSLVFLGYIVSAFLSKPEWSEVAVGLVRPTFRLEQAFLFSFVAIVGTTISPYMQVFVQSSVVEKGVTEEDYGKTKADVWVGTIFAVLIVFFIVVSTAATLHKYGIQVETAADAATALSPLAGRYAELLFGIGLFGASMLAAGVLPLATAYSISEALGFEKGVSRSFKEAPIFLGTFTFLVAVGAAIAVIPNLPLIRVLLVTQVINGLLLPFVLFAILRLVNNKELMGSRVNGPLYNVAAWLTAIIVTALSILYLLTTLFPNALKF
ncbi:MAG TPA: Nramp family divalent metal transporter [Pyrinomonadaceae bacterium]|jgi:NRAMP (natural resistance-associated macrophage protein)-like metal ion transporter|nr:Nramp family divalent metal transporter [Pyrinomonadaceae bacterium]